AACEESPGLKSLAEQLAPCLALIERIEREIVPEPSALLTKGKVIAEGVDESLDKLRGIAFGSKDFILEIQKREDKNTGITSLKISFNNVFGYYLEVTNAHKDKVPASWQRKQTLVNAERYITEELKEYEEQILGAEEKIQVLEQKLYAELLRSLAEFIKPMQLNAKLIAKFDVLLNFASIAEKHQYTRPGISEGHTIDSKGGRHPAIEKILPIGEDYIT